MSNLFKRIFTTAILLPLFFGSYFLYPQTFPFLILMTLAFILIFEWPKLVSINSFKFWLLTPLYPIFPFLCLLHLVFDYREVNVFIPMYPFFVSWIFDSGSYFAGKSFGKHKVCPSISPGKSWEGVFGGLFALGIFNKFIFPQLGLFSIIAITTILGCVAFLGDIFVSFFKRKKGLKDSGNILPGHGGLLDRFDSVLFISVAVAIYLATL